MALANFLKGPLSDRAGGSESVRRAVVACKDSDADDDDDIRVADLRKSTTTGFILNSPSPLFSYQQEIVDTLGLWIADANSGRAALLSLPTGGGKTRTGLWFFRQQAQAGTVKRLLWVAPSTELVQQAIETAKYLWAQFPIALPVQVTVNSLTPTRLRSAIDVSAAFVTAQLAANRIRDVKAHCADLLIFDEAHQSVARTFRAVVQSQLSTVGQRVLGLSATPGRAVSEECDDLQDLFGDNLITSQELGANPVTALRKMGVLSELNIQLIPLPSQWERSRVSSKNRRSMSEDELAMHPARFWAAVETIRALDRGSKCLVFCESVAHCYALTGALRAFDITAAMISHNTPAAKRAAILARFAAGEIAVLLNKTILATGYDCPTVTDVVLATPVRSPILWEQILGRASRGPAVGGTEVGRIWELDDHRSLHGQVLSYARYVGTAWS